MIKSPGFSRIRTGAAAVIVLQMFLVSLIFAFLTINIANIQRHSVAAQIASDLGSRWGVDMVSRSTDLDDIEAQIEEIVWQNWTVNDRVDSDWYENNQDAIDVNVEFGMANMNMSNNTVEFDSGGTPTNAVRVTGTAYTGVVGFTSRSVKELAIGRAATTIAIERDICLVIDRSGSMNFDLSTGTWSSDTSWHSYNPMSTSSSSYWNYYAYVWWWYWPHPEDSRWSTMIPALYALADELDTTSQNEQFSIVSYSTAFSGYVYTHGYAGQTAYYSGNDADMEVTPTFDYQAAAAYIENRYKWDQPVMGGTNISAGIDEAVATLTGSSARPNAFKTIIVMTDGQYNAGRDPALAAEDAADEGIEVFTVTFSDQADQQTMIDAAAAGNGQHFHAPDGDSLGEIFRAIANIPPAAFIE